MGTTQSAAIDRLLELYERDPILKQVAIAEGDAGEGAEQERITVLGSDQPTTQEWAAIGGSPSAQRSETYVLVVHVSAHLDGQDARTARLRLYELIHAIEDLHRNNVALLTSAQVTGLKHCTGQVGGITATNEQIPQHGYVAGALVRILVHARI